MNRTDYHKNLDGVRAIAALMVMFFHFFSRLSHEGRLLNLTARLSIIGQSGVTLFFVLSGFLITRILINSKKETSYFRTFYIRRALRIFPLYYLFLLIYYFLYPLMFSTPKADFRDQLTFYGYFQNIAQTFHWKNNGPNHFWSLAIEEHFYLLWPLVVFLTDVKNLIRIILLIVSVSFLLRIIMSGIHLDVFYFTATRMDALALGALLSCIEYKPSMYDSLKKEFVATVLIVIALSVGITFIQDYPIRVIFVSVKYLFTAGIYFGLIYCLVFFKTASIISNPLSSSLLKFIGKISYGLYVFHPFAFKIINKYSNPHAVSTRFILSFSLSFAIAIVSFELMEKQFLRLKKYFQYENHRAQPE